MVGEEQYKQKGDDECLMIKCNWCLGKGFINGRVCPKCKGKRTKTEE